MKHKSYFNWSGGKDSALALFHTLQNKQYSIERLLTNINGHHQRVSMHGVRAELLEAQGAALGLPLQKIILPEQPTMQEYETQMTATLQQLHDEGFTHSFFGDIFLEDLKVYRERQLAPFAIEACFPLWKKDTRALLFEFIDLGFKAIVVCIKGEVLDQSFAGRIIDRDFIKDLPEGVDPCGENGEFHTFVFDGPIFKKPVPFRIGEKVFREYKAPSNAKDAQPTEEPTQTTSMGFWFRDLIP